MRNGVSVVRNVALNGLMMIKRAGHVKVYGLGVSGVCGCDADGSENNAERYLMENPGADDPWGQS